MPTVIVDGNEIEISPDECLNGIEVARLAGVEVPHYCWHPGLSVVASCRMCLVEAGRRDPETGDISMIPKLVPACQTPANDGTVFVTNSEKVIAARAMVEEGLLLEHPIDCPICDKAGECSLQDYHFQHGQDQRRADIRPFTSRRRSLGSNITLFVDRCIMCSRCVRFCREIPETSELLVTGRGAGQEIDVFPGFPLENKMSGNVVDLCPVGALGDKDFLYKQRVWFLKSHDNVCAGCSSGCSIIVEENQDRVYRLKPRENLYVNQWWMCDEGRYGWRHVHASKRLTQPKYRDGEELVNIQWSDLPQRLDEALQTAGSLAAVLSPHLTTEEAWLLANTVRRIDPQAVLAMGPIPHSGNDQRCGKQFTIRAEKCPNRRGVQQIVSSLGEELLQWEPFLERAAAGNFGGVWISGGYKTDWNDAAVAEKLAAIDLLIVQDMFTSPLLQQADFQLPGAAFAEREGSYVNHADRLQSFCWAVRPPAGVMTEGQLCWRMLQKPGLYNARQVLDDLAREISYFAAAQGPIPAVGVDLKVNQLAGV